ncbi:hypothetical protein KH172YL63_13200 [Bacillus sp. KH172YL63]|nr:hypothetical protein KH172YL63_13200 [Bacillus sp. KH172YL63]
MNTLPGSQIDQQDNGRPYSITEEVGCLFIYNRLICGSGTVFSTEKCSLQNLCKET